MICHQLNVLPPKPTSSASVPAGAPISRSGGERSSSAGRKTWRFVHAMEPGADSSGAEGPHGPRRRIRRLRSPVDPNREVRIRRVRIPRWVFINSATFDSLNQGTSTRSGTSQTHGNSLMMN
jgi:hypothetical protein